MVQGEYFEQIQGCNCEMKLKDENILIKERKIF